MSNGEPEKGTHFFFHDMDGLAVRFSYFKSFPGKIMVATPRMRFFMHLQDLRETIDKIHKAEDPLSRAAIITCETETATRFQVPCEDDALIYRFLSECGKSERDFE